MFFVQKLRKIEIFLYFLLLNAFINLTSTQFAQFIDEDEDDSNEDETEEEKAERKSITEDSYLTVVSSDFHIISLLAGFFILVSASHHFYVAPEIYILCGFLIVIVYLSAWLSGFCIQSR